MENQLDSSWNKRAEEVCACAYKGTTGYYMKAASDFQNRAIEELENKLKKAVDADSYDEYGLYKAIQIIKELKANN